MVVDCAFLTEEPIGSTLFGHVKGAFTGAHADKKELIEAADQGTLFLDEVGEMSPGAQKNLLRVLQEQRFRPVGFVQEKDSNFRRISVTHRDLTARVKAESFREDLMYRIMGQIVQEPQLRDRKSDLVHLAGYFIHEICTRHNLPLKGQSPDFIPSLMEYDWPGNIREFIHCLESTVAAVGDKPILYPQDLPVSLRIKVRTIQLKEGDLYARKETAPGLPKRKTVSLL